MSRSVASARDADGRINARLRHFWLSRPCTLSQKSFATVGSFHIVLELFSYDQKRAEHDDISFFLVLLC